MHLLIRAVSLAGQPLTQAISAYFDERGGTIGRADTNTLALPDPERRISRLQAEVMQGPAGYSIFNVGNANPIWLNQKAVGPGEGASLNQGDELMIGSYALRVSFTEDDFTARTITQGRPVADGRTVIMTSGLDPKTDPSLMTPIGAGHTQILTGHADFPSFQAHPVATPPVPSPSVVTMAPPPAQPATPAVSVPVPQPPAAPSAPAASPFGDLLGSLIAPAAPLPTGTTAATPSAAPVAAPAVVSAPAAPVGGNPFDDLLGGLMPPTPPVAAPAAFTAPTPPVSAPASMPVTKLPDDFDPFADLLGAAPKPPVPAAAPSQAPAVRLPGDLDLLGEIQSSSSSSSLDQMFGLGSGASADPLAAFMRNTTPAQPEAPPVGAPVSVDPLALMASAAPAEQIMEGDPPLRLPDMDPVTQAPLPVNRRVEVQVETPAVDAPPVSPPQVQPLSEPVPTPPSARVEVGLAGGLLGDDAPTSPSVRLPADFDLGAFAPATSEAVPPAPVAAAAPVPASSNASADALWSAFCEGAGIQFAPPQGLNPDLMRVMGQILRHSVDGTLRLIAARAATKQEMRAEVTVIQARRNNPLKFSPDAQSALEQLLQPPLRGFMPGTEAVDDVMDDLLGHTMGTMAGMRAALEGVLARFEPDQLETKLVGRSMLDSLLPMNRRAKLWELYLQHYGSVSNEAKDDFHNLFGKAFLQAYEEQLDRIDAERRRAKAGGAA
jgi:FHA domain-containing protein